MTIRHDVVLADPPWPYFKHGRDVGSRTAASHYRTMDLDAICALSPVVDRLTAPVAALFLWVTFPQLPAGFRVMAAWGFTYKTVAFEWMKLTKRPLALSSVHEHKRQGHPVVLLGKDYFGLAFGMGSYTRGGGEICLLGTRGSMPVDDHAVRAQIASPARGHSQKPEEQYVRIERLYPERRYLELFAREERTGWTCLGDEIGRELVA